MGLRWKPSTITLINEHSDKVTHGDLLLHPYVSALLILHQRSCFLQSTEPQLDSMKHWRDFEMLCFKWNVYMTIPFPQDWDLCRSGAERPRSGGWLQEECFLDTIVQLHTRSYRDCVRDTKKTYIKLWHNGRVVSMKLLTIDNFWERKKYQFYSMKWQWSINHIPEQVVPFVS